MNTFNCSGLKLLLFTFLFGGCVSHSAHRISNIGTIPLDAEEQQIIQNLAYNILPLQKIDMYLPAHRDSSTKIIFYIHGGGWFGGDKEECKRWATYLQNKGYAVASLNYRLTHTVDSVYYQAVIKDIEAAITFVQHNSGILSLSPTQAVIMGASAGGHLALLYAYKYNNKKKIKAAIAFSSLIDLTDQKILNAPIGLIKGGQMITWFLGDTITKRPELWRLASPINYISRSSVPTIFLHGKNDEIIPFEQSVKASEELKAFGINSKMLLLDGITHGILGMDLHPELDQVDQFIKDNVHQ